MLTYKNDSKFKKFVSDVEKLIPELTNVEINLLKKCYRKGMTAVDAANELVSFK